jgi:hypothetical protein
VKFYHFAIPAKPMENMENQTNQDDSNCPDILVKEGNGLLLYNSKKPKVDGENPLPFYNLDEYINYLEIQKKKGIHCPVLYLQKENDAQGNDVYRFRPNPFGLDGGANPYMMTRAEFAHQDSILQNPPPTILMGQTTASNNQNQPVPYIDASRENGIYNRGNYAGYDPHGLFQGIYTEIDKIHDSTETQNQISPNPMDTNWGGVMVTQQAVDSGVYAENEVTRPRYITPRGSVQFPPPGMPAPDDRAY